jgi:hypothetical protein
MPGLASHAPSVWTRPFALWAPVHSTRADKGPRFALGDTHRLNRSNLYGSCSHSCGASAIRPATAVETVSRWWVFVSSMQDGIDTVRLRRRRSDCRTEIEVVADHSRYDADGGRALCVVQPDDVMLVFYVCGESSMKNAFKANACSRSKKLVLKPSVKV